MFTELSDEESWSQFCDSLENSSLSYCWLNNFLHISANPPGAIREKVLETLSQYVKHNENLVDITISGSRAEVVTALCDALAKREASQEISLSIVFQDSISSTHIVPSVANVCSRLHKLYLMGASVDIVLATTLGGALKQNSRLGQLHLWECQIGDYGAITLADALKHNFALAELTLSLNGIGGIGATAIANALKQNSTLTELSLSLNRIGCIGATALAATLKQSTTSLRMLGLYSNKIGVDGATSLADALKHNSTLETLEFDSNLIRDVGATALADALTRNSTLFRLSLCSNQIYGEGLAALSHSLNENCTLRRMFLSQSTRQCQEQDQRNIDDRLRRNRMVARSKPMIDSFSGSDKETKRKCLSTFLKQFTMSDFTELSFMCLKEQVATLVEVSNVR